MGDDAAATHDGHGASETRVEPTAPRAFDDGRGGLGEAADLIALRAELDGIDELALEERAARFDRLHAGVTRLLADLDQL